MRIGFGYDVHRLVEGRKLVIGGVEIPYGKGLAGHSDADVLLHALCDGLLGAMGEGDIGKHFPDTDPQFRGISSLKLLHQVTAILARRNLIVGNLDTMVIAEQPRIMPYIPSMRAQIARAMMIAEEKVNIKATTSEGLGFVGEGEGIAAYAVVLLVPQP
jgi:2-C-methyl-D-erythritol 2,4-cyclodiphosphate synthase